MIERMRNLQPITYQGRIVALVIGDRAIIDDTSAPDAQRHVKAMCLYALELDERQRAAIYRDAAVDAYARRPAHAQPPKGVDPTW